MIQNPNLLQSFLLILYLSMITKFIYNYAYKIVEKQMLDYLDYNLFETNED